MIEIGMTHTVEKTVTADMTAKAVGSGGLEVLGTPYMMGLMECAAMWCVQNELPEGKGTVGVDIASSHLAPTPVGHRRGDGRLRQRQDDLLQDHRLRRGGPDRGGHPYPRHYRQRPLHAEVQRQAAQGQITSARKSRPDGAALLHISQV